MDTKQWVENWRRVGPILEQIEADELRARDNVEAIQRLIPMIDWCIRRSVPRTASGLLEQQRLFQKLRQQQEKQED